MKIDFGFKRKFLGLLCILWTIGFPLSIGWMSEGLYWGTVLFFTKSIYLLLIPPYAIWMLPCFLIGIYQLFMSKQEKFDKIILYLGVAVCIIGLMGFFFLEILHYNPTMSHKHSALALSVGSGFLILLNGLWSVKEIRHKSPSKIRYALTPVIFIFLVLMSYSTVYGRPLVFDPFFYYLIKGNVCEELNLEEGGAILELKFVDSKDNPIPYLEVDMVSEEQNVYGVGILEFSSVTNNEGVTIFKIPSFKYKVRFNTATFPKNLVLPEEEIWIELRKETVQKIIKLQSR